MATYSENFSLRRGEEGDPNKAHTYKGQKLPPDGNAYVNASELVLRASAGFDAVGLSYPVGQDFGPYIQRCGEGLHPRMNLPLNFHNAIPFSAGNVHPHTGMLLYAHVLNQRPKAIVETGTFYGYSTWFMAEALRHWGDGGKVYTIDPEQKLIHNSIKNHSNVECIQGRSEDVLPDLLKELGEVQFCFLDSYKRLVYREFQLCRPYIPEGGIVCFHDTQFLNTGEMLCYVLHTKDPEVSTGLWDIMLHCGKPHKDNGHKFFGNADDRGFLMLRKREKDPFLGAWDANSKYMPENGRAALIALEERKNNAE